MKKKIIVLALIVTLLSGCGSKIPTLSNGDEAVVTLKDGSMISANELYEAIKDDYALDTMITLVDKKILEDKYKDKVEEANEYADSNISQLEAYYGDSLLDAIKQNTSYTSIEGYRNSIYISYLQNLAIEDYCKDQIKEKDIKKYYEDEVVGDIKISHILITPEVTEDMTDDEKAQAETEAKDKVEAIISELKKTDKKEIAEKFAELAAEKSMDETTKENGGSLGFINKDTLSSDYDELVDAAYKLKDGAYSTKVITTELGYHVIYRVETKEKAALEDVKDDIITKLAAEYLENNSIAAIRGLQAVRDEYDFEIVDSELKTQYAEYIQSALNYYQEKDNQSTN
ncbi:MAG: peptidylprolyl isomerase [Candidatus Coprovivens sp.]